MSCAPESDWWRLRSMYFYSGTHRMEDFYRDGSLCYRYEEDEACVKAGLGQGKWTNAAGQVVAYFVTNCHDDGTTICGPFGTAGILAALADGGGYAPGFTPYPRDPSNPACAAWQDPVCQPGCCSTPPGPLPSSSFP